VQFMKINLVERVEREFVYHGTTPANPNHSRTPIFGVLRWERAVAERRERLLENIGGARFPLDVGADSQQRRDFLRR
jgi:hypothetical protein